MKTASFYAQRVQRSDGTIWYMSNVNGPTSLRPPHLSLLLAPSCLSLVLPPSPSPLSPSLCSLCWHLPSLVYSSISAFYIIEHSPSLANGLGSLRERKPCRRPRYGHRERSLRLGRRLHAPPDCPPAAGPPPPPAPRTAPPRTQLRTATPHNSCKSGPARPQHEHCYLTLAHSLTARMPSALPAVFPCPREICGHDRAIGRHQL